MTWTMSWIKQSICEFYNRNTFITEILNVTIHPHYPATRLFRVKEQRDEGEKKGVQKEEWNNTESVMWVFRFLSPRLFWCAELILPGSKIESEIIRLSNNVFHFYLVSEQRKNTWQKKTKWQREVRNHSLLIHTKSLRLFVSTDVPSHLSYMYKSKIFLSCTCFLGLNYSKSREYEAVFPLSPFNIQAIW